ncbi:hypothetical protein JCGZ_00920 [Jatropha curcas]|uniref:Stigma-specific STIG1-like protein 1 n=2 Tax=Jatropha curcas TaxID=180498 RepID=A0A067KW13_JATCU|nr:hypothetical protein JCGZ_00920 [Jatropha curcas]
MAISITLTVKTIKLNPDEKPPFSEQKIDNFSTDQLSIHEEKKLLPSKRLSRFLAEEKNPRAADHCNKDKEICYILGGKNYTCCNNKCFDLSTDNNNCGTCKNKCKHTQACCRGQCVYLSLDKRHCGRCNNRCAKGEYCVFGMCGYA